MALTTLSQTIVASLAEANLAASCAEARRLVRSGAVTVDGERISSVDHLIDRTRSLEVRVGKRRSARLSPLSAASSLAFSEDSAYSL